MSQLPRLVVDASVAAKWVMQEAGSDRAMALLSGGQLLIAPHIVFVELVSAVSRAHRSDRLTRPDAELALEAVDRILKSSALKTTPDGALLGRAAMLALDLRHPLKDCLYLALAEAEGCDLITADQTLIARVAALFPFVRAL
jgi:predicted nucleic acid-binding protein